MRIEKPNPSSFLLTMATLDLSPFARYSQSKCAWPWPWPLQWKNVNRPIERPFATSCLLAISIFDQSVTVLRDNHVYTSECTRFEYLTLKMKIMNVDDLDNNRRTNLLYQRAYLPKKLGLVEVVAPVSSQLTFRKFVTCIRTYGRTHMPHRLTRSKYSASHRSCDQVDL